MNSPEYIQNAIRTESVPASIEINQMGMASIMKLAILSAQLVDMAKRKIFYGQSIDPIKAGAYCNMIAAGASLLANAIENPGEGDLNARIPPEVVVELGMEEFDLDNLNIRLLHSAMGCFTESGELLEALDKQMTTGQLDLVNFGEEIGDIEWYQAIGFDETGVTEAHCREKNIAKLRKRYPEKFDSDQAVNRDLAGERAVLESSSDTYEDRPPYPNKSE